MGQLSQNAAKYHLLSLCTVEIQALNSLNYLYKMPSGECYPQQRTENWFEHSYISGFFFQPRNKMLVLICLLALLSTVFSNPSDANCPHQHHYPPDC
jgi:hypothetical protein